MIIVVASNPTIDVSSSLLLNDELTIVLLVPGCGS